MGVVNTPKIVIELSKAQIEAGKARTAAEKEEMRQAAIEHWNKVKARHF